MRYKRTLAERIALYRSWAGRPTSWQKGRKKLPGTVYFIAPERPTPGSRTPMGQRYQILAEAIAACPQGHHVRIDPTQMYGYFPWDMAEHFPVVHPPQDSV